ncbi:MAG TPA: glycosyltransferase family 2 protein [Chitinophagaceae bacterium]|jgi:glycosyltransferase involved in cell wall biosynthesis|nr:glycosyltransferase family 2 protein [Chitinophagaceae bacterium]
MQRLTAVIITCNEEHNLRRSLPQLTWCNEIIVVDSGSIDNTVQICEKYGCKVYHRKFDGYGAQKQFAVSLATNNWVLCLDADEVLSDKLVVEIQEELINPTAAGYLIPMTFVFMGKEFRYGKESWRYFLRLFNKEMGNFDDRIVHEKVILDGNTRKLQNNIFHYSYRNISQYFNKFNKYSSYGAQIAYEQGKTRSLFMVITAIPFNLFKYYFLELNLLNGLPGFYWSVFNAFYHFVKYIKIRELYVRMEKLQKLGIQHLPNIDLEPDLEDMLPQTNPVPPVPVKSRDEIKSK